MEFDPYRVYPNFNAILDTDWENGLFSLELIYDYRPISGFALQDFSSRNKLNPELGERRIFLKLVECALEYKNHLPFAYEYNDSWEKFGKLKLEFNKGQLNRNFSTQKDAKNDKISNIIMKMNPVIKIVAGPGVLIEVKGFKNKPSVFEPRLEIFRVQNPELVPDQGTTINSSNYIGHEFFPIDYWEEFEKLKKIPQLNSYPNYRSIVRTRDEIKRALNAQRGAYLLPFGSGYDLNERIASDLEFQINSGIIGFDLREEFIYSSRPRIHFKTENGISFYLDTKIQPLVVYQNQQGVQIFDCNTQSYINIVVSSKGKESGIARFFYSIEYNGVDPTIVYIIKSPKGVSIDYIRTEIPLLAPSDNQREYLIVEVNEDDVSAIPNIGSPYFSERNFSPINYKLSGNAAKQTELVFDLLIGFIPIVGGVVDIAESISGYDKWGNKLTTTDRFIIGVGVLLPFVSGGVLKKLTKQ